MSHDEAAPPRRCPLCGEAITVPPGGHPPGPVDDDSDFAGIMRAARIRLDGEKAHLDTHPAQEWADEVLRLRQQLDDMGGVHLDGRLEADAARIVGVLVAQLGGTAAVTARELITQRGETLTSGADDCGGLVFVVTGLPVAEAFRRRGLPACARSLAGTSRL